LTLALTQNVNAAQNARNDLKLSVIDKSVKKTALNDVFEGALSALTKCQRMSTHFKMRFFGSK